MLCAFLLLSLIVILVLLVRPVRRATISRIIFHWIIKTNLLPKISDTEKAALKAGDLWVEKELFSGKPDFKWIRSQPYPALSAEERAFLDGPVERLCEMSDDWDIWKRGDLPEEVWDFLKRERFFGMIIPKSYGGLGFSALAHSEVVMKLSSRCVPLGITTMVPNSLGPAELLIHYGTEEQKSFYLPRLANGREVPCFALTEPEAGSDAGSIQSSGVIFKGTDGKLSLRMNWNKRWITLAAVSTVMGLAFRLRDPDRLLGDKEDLGITCALIPTQTPGVTVNRRHDPLGVPFYNSPTTGKDVVISIDSIIGGPAQAGKGWTMLMESLAAGRGISLPSQSAGGAKTLARVVSAHSVVRKQFGLSIGKFEGVAEPLARIAGFTYLLEALRKYTCGALDQGRKPSIVTAIAKYYSTEIGRKVSNDGMDIRGGAGISLGPKNIIAHGYIAMPISITVEGANILTRSLIIFGQGAIRAHPYAYAEVEAVEKRDLDAFDRAVWGHVAHILRNGFLAVFLTLTRGRVSQAFSRDPLVRYYRKIAWASACFAFLSDMAMLGFGGTLKTREKLTGRFADIMGWMYLAVAALRRFEAEGRPKDDLPVLRWVMDYSFYQIHEAFYGILKNFNLPVVGVIFRWPVKWISALSPIGALPPDRLDVDVSKQVMRDGAFRERLLAGSFLSKNPTDPLLQLEQAFRKSDEAEGLLKKMHEAGKRGILRKGPVSKRIPEAVEKGLLTKDEAALIQEAERLRAGAIQVDDFPLKK